MSRADGRRTGESKKRQRFSIGSGSKRADKSDSNYQAGAGPAVENQCLKHNNGVVCFCCYCHCHSNLGFGISGGIRYIWISMPFLTSDLGQHTAISTSWWGCPQTTPRGDCGPAFNATPTIDYTEQAVRHVVERYNGDPERIMVTGWSRGAIACGAIALENDRIAKLWRAFMPYAHMDGDAGWVPQRLDAGWVRNRKQQLISQLNFSIVLDTHLPGPLQVEWHNCDSEKVRKCWCGSHRDFEAKALVRARYGRLAGRPVLAIAECNVATEIGRAWLAENNLTELGLNYTYKSTGYTNHNDAWALRPGRGRDEMRAWVDAVMLAGADDDVPPRQSSCQTSNASAIVVSGAGLSAVNGRYAAVPAGGCGGLYRDVKFMKDANHTIYSFEGQWRIAHPGVAVWYEAKKGSQLGDGQQWVLSATDAGVAPAPSRVVCEPCASQPCPHPAPVPCPPPPPPPINPECTGIMGYRSKSGSPHGPWQGPTLLQGTTPSATEWPGADGIDNPSILISGNKSVLTGRTCGGKVERPWVATAKTWDGPYESVETNQSKPVFDMVNAEDPYERTTPELKSIHLRV